MDTRAGVGRATLIAVMLLVAGCGGEEPGDAAGGGRGSGNTVVRVASDISSAETWTGARIYLVDDEVVVYSTLSIRPGTIVKFGARGSLSTGGSGTISADGLEEQRVVFTSLRDDARGGDTDGDGGAAAPSRGDWRGILLAGANGSLFRNCDFLYSGGSVDGGGGAALDLGLTDRAVVEGCVFSGNDGGDPDNPRGALSARAAGGDTVIRRNTFFGNNVPLSIAPAVRVDPDNRFRDPGDPSRANRYNGIFVSGGELVAPADWTSAFAPFVLRANLNVGQALTIGPGTVVKLAARVFVQTTNGGTIRADGTAAAKVVFTSIRDDARGGDTNGDGAASSPSAGDWEALLLNGANGSLFRNCEFRYGGYDAGGALRLEQTSGTTVDGCLFSGCDGAALHAAFAGRGTSIANNAFFGNAAPLAINENVGVDGSNVFHDPADPGRTNRYNGIFVHPAGILVAPLQWSATEVPFVIERTMALHDVLSLGAGVVLKFQAGQGLDVYNRFGGELVGWQGARFTSLRDDACLGDTNGDGSATVPRAGDWEGIMLEDTGTGTGWGYANWSNIYYDSH